MKEYQVGNTKIIIYSDFVLLSEKEKKEWFEEQKANGNPVVKEIIDAMNACYQNLRPN